jgi:zinc/manganese transport system substrate-binding protein
MKRAIFLSILLLIGLVSVSNAESDILKVLTTTPDLKSIIEAIGGTKVSVNSLSTGCQDPHFIEAKPGYMKQANKADLWVCIGMELEIGYESLIIDGSRNQRIRSGSDGYLDTSDGVFRLEVPTGKIDHSLGDVHPLGNPHYWMDPYNGRVMAHNIVERLKQLRPDEAEYFTKNYQSFIKKLDELMFGADLVGQVGGDKLWEMELAGKLDEFLIQTNEQRNMNHESQLVLGGWAGKMQPYRGQKIITYHRSWSYFINRFGLIVSEELEPKPGIPPSPKHLADVIKKIESDHVKILLMEPFYSREAPDFIAKKTGITVVEAANSVGGEKEATDYFAMMNNIVERINKAFSVSAK